MFQLKKKKKSGLWIYKLHTVKNSPFKKNYLALFSIPIYIKKRGGGPRCSFALGPADYAADPTQGIVLSRAAEAHTRSVHQTRAESTNNQIFLECLVYTSELPGCRDHGEKPALRTLFYAKVF